MPVQQFDEVFFRENGFAVQEGWSIAVALLSTISSLSVLLTGFMFHEQMVRSKIYMKLILMMSFCDMIGSMSLLAGFPREMVGCSVQGFVYIFFYRASWIWCFILTLTLYYQLKLGVIKLKFKTMNYLVWTLNIVLQVLPVLGRDGYGLPAKYVGYGVCSLGREIGGGAYASNWKWMNGVFFGPLCIFMVLMVSLDFYLLHYLLPMMVGSDGSAGVMWQKLVWNIALYPVGMFFLWMPTFLALVSVEIYPSVASGASGNILETANLALTSVAAGYGFFVAVLFFVKSAEARRRWYKKFKEWGLICGGKPPLATSEDTAAAGAQNLPGNRQGSTVLFDTKKECAMNADAPDFGDSAVAPRKNSLFESDFETDSNYNSSAQAQAVSPLPRAAASASETRLSEGLEGAGVIALQDTAGSATRLAPKLSSFQERYVDML